MRLGKRRAAADDGLALMIPRFSVVRWIAVFGILLALLWVPFRIAGTRAGTAARMPLNQVLERGWLRLMHWERHRADGLGRQDRRATLGRFQELVSQGRAALLAPPWRLAGAYDGGLPRSTSGIEQLEAAIGRPFEIVSIYQAWGDRTEHLFPRQLTEEISAIGSVPMITWEPWVTEFDGGVRTQLRPLPQRETRCLDDIASGEYNFYVSAWARAAREYGRPFFLRFGHEMNNAYRYPWGPQNGNTPASFIRAWRQLHEAFRAEGASNVIWVWSPHIGRDDFPQYYPGDDVVDWTATGVLNYGTAMPWSRWWSFDELFGPHYGALAQPGKPIMIAELGTLANGGSREAWYRDTFAAIERYPAIRAVVLFHQAADATISAAPISWGILDSPAAIGSVKTGLAAAAYRPRATSSHP